MRPIFKPFDPKEKRRFSWLCGGMVFSGALVLIFLMFFSIPEWLVFSILAEAGALILFGVSLFCYLVKLRRHSLRWLKLGEDYQRQEAEALAHFAACGGAFCAELIRECKNTYRAFGRVLRYSESSDKSLFRNEEKLSLLHKMASDLITAIDNGSGWEGFIRFCDEGRYCYRRFSICYDEKIDDPLDGWEMLTLLSSELFSEEWAYLVHKVYDACEFTLKDTHISPEYTASCNAARALFSSSYSPALATFRDELSSLSEGISKALEEAKTQSTGKLRNP